jgi:hypothetical protein
MSRGNSIQVTFNARQTRKFGGHLTYIWDAQPHYAGEYACKAKVSMHLDHVDNRLAEIKGRSIPGRCNDREPDLHFGQMPGHCSGVERELGQGS